MAGNKAIFDTAMKRAHEFAWSNQWERAHKEYARALAEFPEDRTAQRNMAQCLFRLRLWPQAQTSYETLLKADPDDLFAFNRLAEIYLALGQHEKSKEAYLELAGMYTAKNQYHEAIRALRDLVRAMPKDRDVRTRLLELLTEMGDKQGQVSEHLVLSEIALEQGLLGEAQSHAEAAQTLDSDNLEVRRWMFQLKRRLAQTAGTVSLGAGAEPGGKAGAVPGTALLSSQEESHDAIKLVEKATDLQSRGLFREALEAYDQAVKAGAKRASVFYSAGLLNQQMGRTDAAIPYLERASQSSEFAMSASYVMGQCYMAQRMYPRAAAAFERSIALVDLNRITRSEADELIELYTSTANAHMADNNPGRASSLYTNLVSLFKERRFNHPMTSELERRADELYNRSIQSKLLGISRGSSLLDPAKAANGPVPAPQEATRLDLGDGESRTQGGTKLLGDSRPSQPLMPADMPTTMMRNTGSSLRSITEFLRATSQGQSGGAGTATVAPVAQAPVHEATTMMPAAEGTHVFTPVPGTTTLPRTAGGQKSSGGLQHTFTSMPEAVLESLEQQSISVQRLLAEGEQAMAGGQWDVAIDSCMAVIGGDPGYLPVHIMLGDIYLSVGRAAEAMDKYQVVMDTYVARDDHDSAADVCRRMLDVQPDNPTFQTRMGILLMAAGKVDEAARSLLGVAERHYNRGEPERALEEAEALKATMPNSADVALAVGTYRLALGQHMEAMTELSRALHLDPGSDAALARLYITLAQTNDVTQWDALQSLLERAERDKGNDRLFMEELHNAVKQKPVPGVYYGLAVLAGRDGLSDIAADALDQGILLMSVAETSEIDKSWLLLEVLMRQFRGDLALTAKDGAVAAQQYGRVLDILKTHAGLGTEAQTTGELHIQSPRPQYGFTRIAEPLQIYYGLAEAHASQNDWDGAMEALQALKQLMPNDYSVYTRLADIYFRQGQLNQALSELNELLVLFQKAGDNEKTLETLGHMAKLAPNNVAVRRKLSDMYLKLGMTEYGLRELGTLAELQLKAGLLKDAMATYQKAADLHYTLGQHDKAIQIYERIVRIAPRDIDARQQLLNMYVQSGKLKDAVEGERSLADLFIQEGRIEEAIAALHQLLALAPEDVEGHHLLARQLTALGEYGQAARLYGRLLRLEPDNDRIPVLQNEMLRMAREKGETEHIEKAEKAAAASSKKKSPRAG